MINLTTPVSFSNVAAQLFTGLEKHLASLPKQSRACVPLFGLVKDRNHGIHNLGKSSKHCQAEGLRADSEILSTISCGVMGKSFGIAFYLVAAEGISVCKGLLGSYRPFVRLYNAVQASRNSSGMERIAGLSLAELKSMFSAFPYIEPMEQWNLHPHWLKQKHGFKSRLLVWSGCSMLVMMKQLPQSVPGNIWLFQFV